MNDQPLANALKTASQNTLHQVILKVCVESEAFKAAIRRHLVSPKSTVKQPREQEKEIVQITGGEYSVKRLRSEKGEKGEEEERNRWVPCTQCKEQFDGENNRAGSCCWHVDELEMIDDFWCDDNDVAYYGVQLELPGDWRVTEFPDGFSWKCCGGDGVAEGCRKGRHSDVHCEVGSE